MMPSQSKKQHNFMALVANNPSAAKRLKVSQSVGEDFMKADMGKKFKEGGASMKSDLKQDKKVVKKAFSMHDKQAHGGKSTDLTKLKKGGMPKGMMPFEKSKKDVEMKGVKEGSKKDMMMDKKQMMGMKPMMKKGYAEGGMTMVNKGGKMVPDFAADGKGKMAKGGMATMKYAKGGVIAAPMGKVTAGGKRPHGEHTVQTKGMTRGKVVKMNMGGKAC